MHQPETIDQKKIREKIEALLLKAEHGQLDPKENQWLTSIHQIIEIKEKIRVDKPKKTHYQTLIVAVLCLFIVSSLIILKVGSLSFIPGISTNPFSLEIKVKSLQVKLNETGETNLININDEIKSSGIRVNSLSEVGASELGATYTDTTGNLDLNVFGNEIMLIDLLVEGEAFVDFSSRSEYTNLDVLNSSVRGALSFKSGVITIPSLLDTTISESEYNEFIEFHSPENNNSFPVQIRLQPDKDLNLLRGKRISDLQFIDAYADNLERIAYRSSVIGGTIKLHNVERQINFEEEDKIIINRLDAQITDLSVCNGVIHLKIRGNAKNFQTGFLNIKKSLAPSLLEYLYTNRPLIIIWGSLVFIWGLISSIKNQLAYP